MLFMSSTTRLRQQLCCDQVLRSSLHCQQALLSQRSSSVFCLFRGLQACMRARLQGVLVVSNAC